MGAERAELAGPVGLHRGAGVPARNRRLAISFFGQGCEREARVQWRSLRSPAGSKAHAGVITCDALASNGFPHHEVSFYRPYRNNMFLMGRFRGSDGVL